MDWAADLRITGTFIVDYIISTMILRRVERAA
ncbi:hypothetical protein T01_1777 [Trichinella spiralis]|uniref:Uncharacterized protein n=1 Tax=Trichinella spiralis TaxID=6334 RepID=A0A0V0Z2L2_TRISP|nr:hypothetical protein T01_1777 [Trichinella spiralis]